LFYRLIDSNIITTEKAIELGLIEQADDEDEEEDIIEDETPTEIDELHIFDENTISIIFNEDIESIGRVYIYEVNDEDEELDFEIEEMEDDYILIKTGRQVSGQQYTIEIHDI
jgi:hypothetical protein